MKPADQAYRQASDDLTQTRCKALEGDANRQCSGPLVNGFCVWHAVLWVHLLSGRIDIAAFDRIACLSLADGNRELDALLGKKP